MSIVVYVHGTSRPRNLGAMTRAQRKAARVRAVAREQSEARLRAKRGKWTTFRVQEAGR